ncbi:Ctr copper transporter family-domain-containing protein [Achaetomium macrosporum]|uniref:Copper transport protein n=1 Tax=Achaetomium macrosporum TaxID=79813 RepID=A0AAN7C9M5_9PEZI|nr:Ctr copper transporter family-domain-containing protein [Achaetomium macrosporum]
MGAHPPFPRHGDSAADTHSGMTMDMGSDSSMSSSPLMMSVFQNSMSTSLFSSRWTPNSTGTYAGTCIFLIVLAVIFRGLLAFKSWQETKWLDRELNRRYVVVNGKGPLAENLSRDSLAKGAMVLSENGVEENVLLVRRRTPCARPWRLSVDPLRAVIDTVIAGVGYLLMLAVMTMNVGYFLSVLGGTFLGSLLVGRFILIGEH